MERVYFCAYHSFLQSMEPLSDAECGRLFRACLAYSMTREEPELRGNERFIFPTIKQQIDRDIQQYDQKCEKNRKNGAKGGSRYRTVPNAPQEKEKEKEKEKEEINPPISPNGDISPQGKNPPTPKAPKQPKAKKTAYGEFGKVRLTEGEHTKLVQRLGENETRGYIDRLDGYVASTGKRYSSHYATLLSWWRKDQEKPGPSPSPRPKSDRSFESSSFDAKELQDRLLADFMAMPLPGKEEPV